MLICGFLSVFNRQCVIISKIGVSTKINTFRHSNAIIYNGVLVEWNGQIKNYLDLVLGHIQDTQPSLNLLSGRKPNIQQFIRLDTGFLVKYPAG